MAPEGGDVGAAQRATLQLRERSLGHGAISARPMEIVSSGMNTTEVFTAREFSYRYRVRTHHTCSISTVTYPASSIEPLKVLTSGQVQFSHPSAPQTAASRALSSALIQVATTIARAQAARNHLGIISPNPTDPIAMHYQGRSRRTKDNT